MIQGTASDVGKSVMVAAFCRILKEDGLRVAPFKAQNMALNSFVTPEGGEIGRAQAMQAEACGIPPHVDMNPILMKPFEDTQAQIIFRGRPVKNMSVAEYAAFKASIFPYVLESLDHLRASFDVVVIEGAGSPAEINLKEQDIVNMRIAEAAESPVILVGDIDRGGVFASLVGTLELLEPEEKRRIAAFVINKFRGERALLDSGLGFLSSRTLKPVLGVIPYMSQIGLAEEDALHFRRRPKTSSHKINVRVVLLPHLSNFTDFDALAQEGDVDLAFVKDPELCRDADILILPGSKSTVADLQYLKVQGFAELLDNLRGRCTLVGICAGFQMFGERILDPGGIETDLKDVCGFGIIPATTEFEASKHTSQVTGYEAGGSLAVSGYQIHHGRVTTRRESPWLLLSGGTPEGYADTVQNVYGTSVHGIFDEAAFRRAFLNRVRCSKGWLPLAVEAPDRDKPYREWAALVRKNIDMDLLYRIVNGRY